MIEQDHEKEDECEINEQLSQYLESHNIKNLTMLHNLLFNEKDSINYHKNTISEHQYFLLSHKSNRQLALKNTYKQLYVIFENQSYLIEQVKAIFKFKYEKDDIIRTHKEHKMLWLLCSGYPLKEKQFQSYYQLLKNCENYPQYFKRAIEADVKRTQQQKSEQNHAKLNNILKTLSKRNPYIGYCQGMNFIINFLLVMHFSQEESFWIASHLFEEVLPKNYYTDMIGVAIDLKILELFLKMKRPIIYQRLNSMQISLSFFALEWIVCLFTTILPYYLLVLVWDLLFLNGSSVLIKTCIIILDEFEPIICQCKDFTQFLFNFQKFKKNFVIEQGNFIAKLRRIFIDDAVLQMSRYVYDTILKSKATEDQSKNVKKHQQIICNPDWPICHEILRKSKLCQQQMDIWVFRESGQPKLIEDYLQCKNKYKRILHEDQRQTLKKLMIGRFFHICDPTLKEKRSISQIQLHKYESNVEKQIQISEISSEIISQTSLSFLQRASTLKSFSKSRSFQKK